LAAWVAEALTVPSGGVLDSYGKLSLPFTFKPVAPGWVEVPVEVVYDNDNCGTQTVLVKAHGVPPPIYVQKVWLCVVPGFLT
jgi:hypothetical protein